MTASALPESALPASALPTPALTGPAASSPAERAAGAASVLERWPGAVMGTYATPPLTLVRGEGARVWDDTGSDYVDLLAGIAVNALGHAHPAVVSAVSRQVATLGHVSNLYAHPVAVTLAERLLTLLGWPDGRVFFCNSGAEATEAAIKLSRRTGRTGLVAARGGFHGRTMGALSVTGQPAKQDPFRPLLGDVTFVPYADPDALRAAVTAETAAVFLEPVQGEGGVVPAPPGYLDAARAVTAERGALLVLDEVQTGIGRTGAWFAHQRPSSPTSEPDAITMKLGERYSAHEASGSREADAPLVIVKDRDGSNTDQASRSWQPDVVTLAKGLGGGLPIGACVARGAAAELLSAGQHGTTFGGNPIACAAALAVLDTIAADGLLERAGALGARLRSGVTTLGHPLLDHVRGAGLLLGIVLTAPVAAFVEAALRDAGFLVNAVAPGVIRLAPPLVLTDEQADAFLAALPSALDRASHSAGRPA